MHSPTFYLLILFAYLLGGVPFGLLWGRLFADVDIRELGSGNIGATNMNRVLGKKLGAATLASDVLKSVLVVWMAIVLLDSDPQAAIVALAAVLGHCFPIYLKFKGGKGVATAFGSVLVLSPLTGGIALGIWLLVFRLSKVSALSAIVACATVPAMIYFNVSPQVAFVYILMMAVIIMRHSSNIERLRQGKELGTTLSAEKDHS